MNRASLNERCSVGTDNTSSSEAPQLCAIPNVIKQFKYLNVSTNKVTLAEDTVSGTICKKNNILLYFNRSDFTQLIVTKITW